MLPRVRLAVCTSVVLGFGTVCLLGVAGEKSGGAAAPVGSLAGSLMEYEIDGGEGYLALSLRGSDNAGRIKTPHDHAVIIDTSASQTGAHRQQGLAVLEAFVAALPAGDRVNVVAIDVAAHSLSNGFHAAGADETKKPSSSCAAGCRWGRPIWGRPCVKRSNRFRPMIPPAAHGRSS